MSSPHEHAVLNQIPATHFRCRRNLGVRSRQTLYPHDLNLWQQIDDRIRSFVSDYLKVSKDEAFKVQKDYYKRYGTTMRGRWPSTA